jgi:integrase
MVEAEEHRTQVRRGEVIAPSRLTFGEVAEAFLEVTEALVATGERSQRTVDLYRQQLRSHISPVIGRRRVQDVRAEHIAAIFARQRRSGLASWTISGTQTIISAVLGFALSRGYIGTNPLDRLARIEKPHPVTEREPRRLSDEEIRNLCAAATNRYRPVVTTLSWTGLRVSEALALRWADIDFAEREIRVQFQLDGAGKLKRPKTRAGRRVVPLLPVVSDSLKKHRKEQLRVGSAGPDHFVFTTISGKPLDRHNVRTKGVVAAAVKAGIQSEGSVSITTHDLRRTFISHLIVGLGLDPVRVAKIVGHANPTMTMNIYADEFDKALHRDDLRARIDRAGFGASR